MLNKKYLFFFSFIISLLAASIARGQNPEPAERLAFAAYRHGQWDIYSILADGTAPRQLTNDVFADTDPAYSPDGSKLAFASRRANNWDVYVLDLQTGAETRLTHHPQYDGSPTWSSDGSQIAYESHQNGNLDIWLVEVEGGGPATNLTASSTEGDFAPAWSPTGNTLAFTSWRNRSSDLFLINVVSGEVTPLTNTPTAEEWPAWHPNGKSLAYVVNDLGDREIFILDVDKPPAAGGSNKAATWLGRTGRPVWNPSGDTLAAIFQRWDGEIVVTQAADKPHTRPHLISGVITSQGRITWHKQALDFGQPVGTLADSEISPLFEEVLLPNEPGREPYNMVRINDLEAGTPWLADTVDDSFLAWRYRLRDEVGYDFLGTLSDAARDMASYTDTSQYASWHKSGRAIDTLFDYHLEGQLAHEIVREEYGGETYWRVYLRCTDQTGRCGRPLTANPWNYSSRARTEIAPEQGGIEKAVPAGYYVDMTAMAREYGWERISSHDDEEYSWTWHFLAFEYWHYQKKLANSDATPNRWYQAMLDIYPPQSLEQYFNWYKMRSLNEDPHLVALKGVPLPLEMKPWWALVEQEH